MSKLVLNSIIRAIGFTQGAWRHPDATPERAHDLGYYQETAAISERGLTARQAASLDHLSKGHARQQNSGRPGPLVKVLLGLNEFVDHVVPLLQAKGIYKRGYAENITSRAAFA